MAVLFVVLASLLVFRGLGAIGVVTLATWKESTRYALAVMFLFTSGAHFTGSTQVGGRSPSGAG